MNFEDFINYCYQSLLGREPDNEGKNNIWKRWRQEFQGEKILLSFIDSPEFVMRQKILFDIVKFVPPGHFYSPIPDITECTNLYHKIDGNKKLGPYLKIK